jgi:hypothetical protein
MKLSFIIIMAVSTLAVFSLTSCKGKDATVTESHTESKNAAGGEHDGHIATSVVQLNNGERWQANPETLQGIGDMLEMTNAYITGRQTDVNLLKSELETRFKLIFTECTMTGEAHEQLHAYLIPIKGMLEGLNQDTANDTVRELNEYLRTFDDYFM